LIKVLLLTLFGKFDPYSFVEVELLEDPLLITDSVDLFKYVVLEYGNASLLEIVNLFVNYQFILIDCSIRVFHCLKLLKSTEILTPM
jgi:hypothetical protein